MSIKAKLALMISLVVTVILSLNISIYYFSSKSEMQTHAERQMAAIAKQIGTTLEATEKSRKYMEDTIGEKLRIASIAAMNELDPRIDHVSNEQLADLSSKLGVDHITLWKQFDDDIVALKSSDPAELNLGSKSWDYWFTAFSQLFRNHNVTVPQGQKLSNYWAGPINYSSSVDSRIDKWGYYYDGTTDYIIDPYVDAKVFLDFANNTGTNALIGKLLTDNPDILEVTGFDPQFFGKPPIMRKRNGVLVQNLDASDIAFGKYSLKDKKNDIANVQHTAGTGQMLATTGALMGKNIIKSFIPIAGTNPYVIGIVFDHGVIEEALKQQLLTQGMISLGLVIAAWIGSYILAGFLIQPLRQILHNVNEIAEGRFGNPIRISSRDEVGLLSLRVNTMADNLQTYTDRLKDVAQELRGTKEYLESFVNQTSDAIHVTDLEGRVIQVNKAFEKMFGWRAEEVLSTTLPHQSESRETEYGRIVSRVLQGESVADYETVRHDKHGDPIDMSITVSPIRNENSEIVAIAEIARNITARKQTEEVIRRSEKLSVIGQLAAGVAHEIRNPLATLRGFVQLQKERGALSSTHLDLMLSELDRINFIVSEFMVLAKPQAEHYQPVDVRTLLDDILMLLDSQAILDNVQFETLFEPDIPALVCEPNQLKQVFLNLLKNGIEAMPHGGTMSIELQHDLATESMLILITDQGSGIPEELLHRLGEPFLTSKPMGNGLGLMVSQRIIANHKGSMSISSRLGEGTCVEIRLPASVQSIRMEDNNSRSA